MTPPTDVRPDIDAIFVKPANVDEIAEVIMALGRGERIAQVLRGNQKSGAGLGDVGPRSRSLLVEVLNDKIIPNATTA